MMDMRHSESTIAVPPGATIREQLEIRGMSQKEFAVRMDLSEKHVSRLINGQVELTKDVALRLEWVLGVPALFWNNLEMIFREKLARIESEKDLEEDFRLASRFPYSKIADLGWVTPTRSKVEKVVNLREYFGVAKLGVLDQLKTPGIACRRSGQNAMSDHHLIAWARKAKLEALKIDTGKFDPKELEGCIPSIREMTALPPDQFFEDLCGRLAGCGVALVCLPHIGGSFLNGASFRDNDRVVMALSLRGKDADKFWFSFFHELYHILRGHINGADGATSEEKAAADVFARDTLIPPDDFEKLISDMPLTGDQIIEFARSINISPGIVVGRLQKEGCIPFDQFNGLKEKYVFAPCEAR